MTDIVDIMAGTSTGYKGFISGYLKRIKSNPVGEIIPLFESKATIGRHKDSSIWVFDLNISRFHCELNYSSAGWSIVDNGTVNGTYLDGIPLLQGVAVQLRDGVAIHLGPPEHAQAAFVFFSQKPNKETDTLSTTCSANNESSSVHLPMKQTEPISRSDKRIFSFERSVILLNSSSSEDEDIECHVIDASISQNRKYNQNQKRRHSLNIQNQKRRDSLSTQNQKRRDSLNIQNKKRTDSVFTQNQKRRDSQNTQKQKCNVNLIQIGAPNSSGLSVLATASSSGKNCSVLNKNGVALSKNLTPVIAECDSLERMQRKEENESLTQPINNERSDASRSLHEEFTLYPDQVSSQPSDQKRELRGKVCYLQMQLVKAQSTLEKVVQDNMQLSNLLQGSQERNSSDMKKREKLKCLLEEELSCNICTEILITPIILCCSHTFCEHCIHEWMLTKKQCPICRKRIDSETKVLALDGFISKCMTILDDEDQVRKWKEVRVQREANTSTQRAANTGTQRETNTGTQRETNTGTQMETNTGT